MVDINNLKMTRKELADTLENVVDNLNEEDLREWFTWLAGQSVTLQKSMLKYVNGTNVLKNALEYSGVFINEE
jgi:hypothetical protein